MLSKLILSIESLEEEKKEKILELRKCKEPVQIVYICFFDDILSYYKQIKLDIMIENIHSVPIKLQNDIFKNYKKIINTNIDNCCLQIIVNNISSYEDTALSSWICKQQLSILVLIIFL